MKTSMFAVILFCLLNSNRGFHASIWMCHKIGYDEFPNPTLRGDAREAGRPGGFPGLVEATLPLPVISQQHCLTATSQEFSLSGKGCVSLPRGARVAISRRERQFLPPSLGGGGHAGPAGVGRRRRGTSGWASASARTAIASTSASWWTRTSWPGPPGNPGNPWGFGTHSLLGGPLVQGTRFAGHF